MAVQIKGFDPVRQGPSSAQLQGQSCQVPRNYGSREGLWNEDSLFSGMVTSQLPVPLRVSYNKRTVTHSLEGRQEVREETRAQGIVGTVKRSPLSVGVCPGAT